MVLAQTPKRASSSHEKKRHGHHHKHTKHYEKTYWPYLPLLAIVIVALIGNSWLGRHQVLGVQTSITAQTLLQDTNTQRTNDHEAILSLNAQLASAAQNKANDMATRDYWSHNTPDGKTPWTFMQQSGYQYQVAGENLAYGFADSDAVISGWMNSTEHRANILDSDYQNVGFGIAQAAYFQGHGPETIVVAMYAEPVGTAPARAVLGDQTMPHGQYVSRIQLWTGGAAPWSLALVSLLAGVCLAVLVIRHGLFLRRAFVRSEEFIIKHPMLDVAVVTLGMASFILTRATGFIH